jgi:hypothetical protein
MPGGNLIYDTNTLVEVVPNLKTSQNWLADRFYPNIIEADSEFVSIDVDVGKRRMAPFVSPLVEGRLIEQRRYQTNTFKPAYTKDKRAPDLRKPVRRMIGERIGGDMSGEERQMANLEFELTDQIDMLNRRIEWMAASALEYGQVTIAGDGFESVTVNFGRDASLSVTLTGTSAWGVPANFTAAGKDPLPTAYIEGWQRQILQVSGAVVTDVVFTTAAWALFMNSVFAEGAIFYPKLGDGNALNPGAEIKQGAVFKGWWGQYQCWLYNDWYVDPTNTEQPMITDGMVILCGEQLMGTRAFGQIMDPRFNYEPMAYAPKTWISDDPAQQYVMMQSSPIVIPSRVNACLAANVLSGDSVVPGITI